MLQPHRFSNVSLQAGTLRRSCHALVLGVLALTVAGFARAAVPDAPAVCRLIVDNAKRLACYDGLAQDKAAAPSAAVVAVPAPAPASPPPTAPLATSNASGVVVSGASGVPEVTPAKIEFGAETVKKAYDQEGVNSLSAHLVGDIDGIKKGTELRLDNGQIWESIDDHDYMYEGDKPALTINRNFAGSYWMRLENSKFNVRVSRVQ
ncbi:hypothetical protein [Nevskia soli]|uniref:hypothetical protein n=1 Tax=Nevskia soli TaxID=418856 RepID=UPI001FE03B83|nr:hypothetical protein [Nevskia soli]